MRLQIVALVSSILAGSLLPGPVAAQSKAPPFQPVPSTPAAATLFTIPYVELNNDTNFTPPLQTFPFVHLVYTAGQVDDSEPVGATVHIHLFDRATGLAMKSQTGVDICNPCSVVLGTTASTGPAPRQVQFNIQNAVFAAGGIDKTLRGSLQYRISGDAAYVAVQVMGTISGTTSQRILLQAFPVR